MQITVQGKIYRLGLRYLNGIFTFSSLYLLPTYPAKAGARNYELENL